MLAGTSPWEALPLVSRNLSFVVTARDVNANYGCTVQDQTEITVANAGPFRVTVPNGGENWVANSTRTVTWNVAGTTGNGINTTNVRIDLSLDGGFTYPVTLLASTPNDGSQQITVPDVTENRPAFVSRPSATSTSTLVTITFPSNGQILPSNSTRRLSRNAWVPTRPSSVLA